MVNYCRVIGCHNRSDREKGRSFYRIPEVITNQCEKTHELSEERRRKWLASLNQDLTGKTVKNIRICSDHFIGKKKADLFARDNPDWTPFLNMGTSRQVNTPDNMSSRYFRKKGRAEKSDAAKTLLMFAENMSTDEPVEDLTPLPSEEPLPETEVEMLQKQLALAKEENEKLKCKNHELKEKLKNTNPYSDSALEGNDEKVRSLTGLPCFALLMALFRLVEECLPPKMTLGKFECLVLTLARLRLNLTISFLAFQLAVSKSTISRIFVDVIDVLYVRTQGIVRWPEREELQKTMPLQFQKHFGKKCCVIIDCFEVFIECPSNLMARSETWSNYKHHNTVKFLIGIAPQGVVSFISKSWGGRTSDKFITEHCGFLNKLLPGDLILADRGFDIGDSVGTLCASVNIPAFTKGKGQLSPLDLEETRKIANVRIHVERVIGLVRQKFTFLNGTQPIDVVMTKDERGLTTIDKVAYVCCALVNMCESVVDFN
ncbi:uncharacterized protein LOC127860158 [Dreissena polymorpha]|nr:uncharacterized protein LOC127860158 [Dreissena polymorpha]